jgi:hypothetical protein
MSNRIATLVFAALTSGVPIFAIEYADFDILNQTIAPEPGGHNAAYYGTFDLLTAGAEGNSADMSGYGGEYGGNGIFSDIGGFQRGSHIDNATVAFWFSDPQGSGEQWAMRVEVTTLTRQFYHTVEEGTDLGQEYYYQLFESPMYDVDILFNLSETGQLNYKVQVDNGSFRLDAGILTVNATQPVPDGGSTAILLGLGMIGMVGVQRKLRK